jgi:hypothetical protein
MNGNDEVMLCARSGMAASEEAADVAPSMRSRRFIGAKDAFFTSRIIHQRKPSRLGEEEAPGKERRGRLEE